MFVRRLFGLKYKKTELRVNFVLQTLLRDGLGNTGSRGLADPLKLGDEVRNCIWRLCYFSVVSYEVHLSFASRSHSPLYGVNNQHDFKGWVEN